MDFFQGAAPGFGIEEIDGGKETGVYDCDEEVGSSFDVGDHYRSGHHYCTKKLKIVGWSCGPINPLHFRLSCFV
jgi:hypothetical protein